MEHLFRDSKWGVTSNQVVEHVLILWWTHCTNGRLSGSFISRSAVPSSAVWGNQSTACHCSSGPEVSAEPTLWTHFSCGHKLSPTAKGSYRSFSSTLWCHIKYKVIARSGISLLFLYKVYSLKCQRK